MTTDSTAAANRGNRAQGALPLLRELRLYHTLGCHLCEQAQALLEPLAHHRGWRIAAIDIATDDALLERYGTRIPVLHDAQAGTELGWPFDAAAVIAAFG